jgi:predicted nucleic acid-binding protein
VRFYFDTSVLGAVTDREDPRRIEATRKVLQALEDGLHDGVISNVVQEELEEAPTEVQRTILQELNRIEFELVTEDLESRNLFQEYEAARILPRRYRNDLRHVAVATVARVDALVSWNFRHLVNLRTRRAVHAVNVRMGYPLIEIVSPEEV